MGRVAKAGDDLGAPGDTAAFQADAARLGTAALQSASWTNTGLAVAGAAAEGRGRYDDPAVTNTGEGTLPYGDLGALEGQP